MPGNRRGNDLKESAPVFDDRAHAPARPSRGKGRRNFPLAQPVAEHEKPREIGEPDVVRIDGVPAFRTSDVGSRPTFRTSDVVSLPTFKADGAGGPPSFRDRPRPSQCGNALFAAHGGESLGAEQLLDRREGVRAQVFPQSRGDVKGRGIGPLEGRGGPVEGGGADGIGIHASSVCEPSDSCARANRTPANARNGAPATRPRQSADSTVNGLGSQRIRQWPAHAPVTKFPPQTGMHRRRTGICLYIMPSEPPVLHGRARARLLFVLISGLFLSLITVSIINVALPSIKTALDASPSQMQWALSGYSLAIGVVLVAAGRAGDILGRGRLFAAGVLIFAIASTAAALAVNALMLDVARAVMGFGAGIYTPQTGGLIQQHYRGKERAKAFGIFGATVGVAVAIGPTVGGVFLELLPASIGWRATLGFNVPVAATVFLLALKWIPREPIDAASRGRLWRRLDPVGAVLLAVAIVGVMLPFVTAATMPWAWWFLPVGFALVGLWWLWEHRLHARGGEPMVDPRLLRIRSFTLGAATITAFFAGSTTMGVILADFVQRGMGETALVSGMLALPTAAAQVVSAPLAGRLVWRWGRRIVIVGIFLNVVGLAAIAAAAVFVSRGASVWWFAIGAAIVGFGIGWVTSPNQALSLRDVPVESGGTASGIMQTGQRIATAIGTAACTGLFYSLAGQSYVTAMVAGCALLAAFISVALAISYWDARHPSVQTSARQKQAVREALESTRK